MADDLKNASPRRILLSHSTRSPGLRSGRSTRTRAWVASRQGAQRHRARHEAEIGVRFAGRDKLVHLIEAGEVVHRLGRGFAERLDPGRANLHFYSLLSYGMFQCCGLRPRSGPRGRHL